MEKMAYYQKVPAKNKQGYKWKVTEDAPPHPITGKRRQVTRRADGKKEAYQKVLDAIEEIKKKDRGEINVDLEGITVKQLFGKWFELVMKRKLKETTFKEYTNCAKNRIIPVIGDYKVSQLNSIILQKYINDLSDDGLSPRYVEYISTILYGALEQARKWKVIPANPLIDVEKPRPRRTEMKTWTVDEMHRFLNYVKLSNYRLYHIVNTAIKTGCRRGEVLALKWSDLDEDKGYLRVERSLVYDREGYRFTTPKTNSSVRNIKVGESLIKELKEWKVHQNKLKMALRKSYQDEDLIFTTQKGKPIYPRTMTFEFNKAIEESGVTKIRFHDLRHTHATICLEAGMSLKEVQERLGHSSIKTTGDVYAHVTENMKEKSVELFESYVGK
jgi:integrase